MGIAVAGSSLGGVMYPLALQKLFKMVGFAWGVRVSALISGICCGVAVLIVSAVRVEESGDTKTAASASSVDEEKRNSATFDAPYALLGAGSALVALGMFHRNSIPDSMRLREVSFSSKVSLYPFSSSSNSRMTPS